MEQVMEMLKTTLVSMVANQARMEAEDKAWWEEMEARRNAWRKETTACQAAMESNLEKMDANLKSMQERMNAGHKEIMAWLKDLKINGEETMACQEKTEARLQGQPASEDMTLEVAHEHEVPLEDAVVMPVGEPRKRHWD
jgi:ABC-type Zn2+ transport system substrate-binding protein/surface adhesin